MHITQPRWIQPERFLEVCRSYGLESPFSFWPFPNSGWCYCYWKVCVRGPAAHRSKANKQARLVERKVCFTSDANNWGRGWQTSVQRSPPHPKVVGESFYRWGWGDAWGEVTCRNSTVISNCQLQLVISGVTSIILVVLGTVNLQFHSTLISLSLQSILEIVAT